MSQLKRFKILKGAENQCLIHNTFYATCRLIQLKRSIYVAFKSLNG